MISHSFSCKGKMKYLYGDKHTLANSGHVGPGRAGPAGPSAELQQAAGGQGGRTGPPCSCPWELGCAGHQWGGQWGCLDARNLATTRRELLPLF